MTAFDKIGKICDKAISWGLVPPYKRLNLLMDIDCANIEFDLDLDKLLAFDSHNFSHDIIEIQRHIDRKTKKFKNCFVPRCSKGGN